MRGAGARANSNIALIKYWGKRDVEANLPAVGSVSMTLSGMFTSTAVFFRDELSHDRMEINGLTPSEKEAKRITDLLDIVRKMADIDTRAEIRSTNSFPTAAGLASSASGFAALAAAASKAAGLDLDDNALADLARRGSGSAPRSLLGGFVELDPGTALDGSDVALRQVLAPDQWDLCLVIAQCAVGRKKTGSTDGMERTRATSTYYDPWVATHADDRREAVEAIATKDFTRLGLVTESSCFKMHASALAARPPVLYWNGATLDAIHEVWQLREDGVEGYATIDAGPHVKVLCQKGDAVTIADRLGKLAGVRSVDIEEPGEGIHYYDV